MNKEYRKEQFSTPCSPNNAPQGREIINSIGKRLSVEADLAIYDQAQGNA